MSYLKYLKKHTHDPSYSNLDLLSALEKLLFMCIIFCYIDGKVSFNSFMRDTCALRMPIKSILLFKEGVLAFTYVKGLAPSYLTARFNKRSTVHDKDTRNKDSLIIPHYKSLSGQRTFFYRGIRLWNSFPIELRDLNEIGRLKRELKDVRANCLCATLLRR